MFFNDDLCAYKVLSYKVILLKILKKKRRRFLILFSP